MGRKCRSLNGLTHDYACGPRSVGETHGFSKDDQKCNVKKTTHELLWTRYQLTIPLLKALTELNIVCARQHYAASHFKNTRPCDVFMKSRCVRIICNKLASIHAEQDRRYDSTVNWTILIGYA
jgi:hypothetical protein